MLESNLFTSGSNSFLTPYSLEEKGWDLRQVLLLRKQPLGTLHTPWLPGFTETYRNKLLYYPVLIVSNFSTS